MVRVVIPVAEMSNAGRLPLVETNGSRSNFLDQRGSGTETTMVTVGVVGKNPRCPQREGEAGDKADVRLPR